MALIVNPGQNVAQPDWDALAEQHGGVKGQATLRAPTESEIKAAGMAQDDDPAYQQRPIYRYYFNDGTYVEARTSANGADYQVVDYKPSQPFTAAQTRAASATSTESPTAKRTAREEAEIAANAALPPDQDPRAETNAERAARADRVIKEQGAAARQEKLDADAKAEKERQAKRQEEADARQARIDEQNTATQAANASRAASAESRAAAQANRIPNPDVPGGFLEKGPDGTWRPIKTEGIPTGSTPEGAPVASGKLGEAAADLAAFTEWLNKERRKPGSTMTNEQADKLLAQRHAYWKTALDEQQGIVNAQSTAQGQAISQRGQTLGDLSNRRSSATSIANQAAGDFMPLMTKLGSNSVAGGASIADAIRAARVNAQDFVTMTGANREVPEIMPGPALASVNGMALPGQSNLNVRPNTAPPNAIGAGVVPGAMAPQQAAKVAPPPEIPMTPERVQGIMANPVFRPQPMAGAAPQPPMPGQGQDISTPQAMIQPQPWFLAGASRGHAYDPSGEIQRMIADPRLDNNIIRQVVAEEYPGYPIDDLLGAA